MSSYDQSDRPLFADAAPYRRVLAASRTRLLRDGTLGTFSERHIQCIWYDPALRPRTLQTRSGEQVVVQDPGRWNSEAGPDFCGATLLVKPGLRRIQGDIEIHIHPADWEHHKHAEDPRYRHVVAHVTLYPGLGTPAGLPPGTLEMALEPALRQNPVFRMDAIDTSAYPFAARLQQCACGILLKEDTSVDPGTLLQAAGCYRMEQKIQAMHAALQHSRIDDLLYHQTMAALGYKQHSANFTRLADMVPRHSLIRHSPLEAYAILMGTAHLLPDTLPPGTPAANKRLFRQLWDIWWKARRDPAAPHQLIWKGPAGRPANQPTRRLVAAAVLFTHPHPWQEVSTALWNPNPRAALRDLFAPPPSLAFWHNHTTLATPAMATPKALVGHDRLAAWCNNVVLPLAAAHGADPHKVLSLCMPEQINANVRQTANRLLGRDHNPALYRQAGIRQQGLLQIFHDFCSKGCHDCALAETLRQGTFSATAACPIPTT